MRYTVMESPVGDLLISADDHAMRSLFMPPQGPAPSRISDPVPEQDWVRDDAGLSAIRGELSEYFAGQRAEFTLAVAPAGTAFQQQVWKALLAIPYGQTVTYGAIADAIGSPKAVRAVGAAIGRNPISIVIPCHRVVGAGGSLTGYAGGVDNKRWLLSHERGAITLD